MKLPVKVLATSFALSLAFAGSAFAHGEEDHTEASSELQTLKRVVVQGDTIKNDVMPKEVDGELFVPLRFIAEKYGFNVSWNADTSTVELVKEDSEQKLQAENSQNQSINIMLNGSYVNPDDVINENGRVLVPLKYMEDLLNVEIHNAPHANSLFFDQNQLELDGEPIAYFPNGMGNTVSAVNLTSGEVVDVFSDEVIPGATNSHGIAINNEGTKLYVSSMNGTEVSVFNLETQKTEQKIDVGFKTHHMEIDPLGRYLYVTELKGTKVAVVDLKTNSVVKSVVTGKGAYYPTASLDGSKLYVANIMENTVTVIDLETLEVESKINVGKGPSHFAIDPDTNTIYVTNSKGNSISIISEDGKDVKELEVGAEPHGIAVSGNNIIVANAASNDVTIINKQSLETNTIAIGKQPGHVTAAGDQILVQLEGDNQLSVIDAASLKVVNKIELLSDGHQIAIGK